ncbi:MAG TPA: BRO family protein [Ktedonobacteraceae bacterium]|jgi:DNA-damage-inducible protein D
MTEQKLGFESIKRTNVYSEEYWSDRELMPLLGYDKWERFEGAIKRAMTACETNGISAAKHFPGTGKMLPLGSGSQRRLHDYHLSRFACYLIAMNGDPRKEEIAAA